MIVELYSYPSFIAGKSTVTDILVFVCFMPLFVAIDQFFYNFLSWTTTTILDWGGSRRNFMWVCKQWAISIRESEFEEWRSREDWPPTRKRPGNSAHTEDTSWANALITLLHQEQSLASLPNTFIIPLLWTMPSIISSSKVSRVSFAWSLCLSFHVISELMVGCKS